MSTSLDNHKSLKRTKSAEPQNARKKSPRFPQNGQQSLRLTYLEAYIPVAVVEYLKSQVNKSFSVEKLPLIQHEKESVVMFIDVSSFTTMTETMTFFGPGGLEKLVEQLNLLFSMMLKRIRKQGGDVLKFAGDAIEVYWPVNPCYSSLEEAVIRAVSVALKIQELITRKFSEMDFEPYGQDKEDVCSIDCDSVGADSKINASLPQELRVKLGIGVGKMTMVHLGGSQDTLQRDCVEFIPIGKGIVDAHSCERSAKRGQVIISEAVFAVIKGMGFATELVAGNAEAPFFVVTGYEESKTRENTSVLRGTVVPVGDEEPRRPVAGSERRSSSRQKTLTLLKNRVVLEEFLDGYLPSTVIPYIKEQNEFWLPEFRRVTTIFFKINLELSVLEAIAEGKSKETHWLQDSFKIIQSTVFRYEGSINKMFFDKGSWNVLVVFGLSPFAHDDDPFRGILCALAVVGLLAKHLNAINEGSEVLSRCSAGITTGLAFCGVLGSTKAARETSMVNSKTGKGSKLLSGLGIDQLQMIKREQKEYSVLGDCINIASRLMDLAYAKGEALFFDENTAVSTGEAIENIPFSTEPISVKGKSQLVKVFQIAEKSDSTEKGDSDVYQKVKKNRLKRMSVVRGTLEKPLPQTYSRSKIPLFGRRTKTANKKKTTVAKTNKRVQNKKRSSFFSPKRRRASTVASSSANEPTNQVEARKSIVEPERHKRRKSVFHTLRAKKSLPVDQYTKTEETVRQATVKKKPVRRSTLIFLKQGEASKSMSSSTSIRNQLKPQDLMFVLKRLEEVRFAFKDSCDFVRDKKSFPQRYPPKQRRRSSIRPKVNALESSPGEKQKKQFQTVRLICVEGSIGAGKTHAIAQVFYSKPSKAASRVFLVTTSPFESRDRFKGFSVWREFFNKVLQKVNTVRNVSKESLIEEALQMSAHTFEISPSVVGLSAQKKFHKPNADFLYLLNEVFESDFKAPSGELLEINTAISYSEEELMERLVSRDPISPTDSGLNVNNDRAIRETVNLVSGVISGLAQMCFTEFSESKDMIAIIDDAQLLPTNSWLVCMELVEWWLASNLLIVLGLRNVSFFDPNEKKKQLNRSQIVSSTFLTVTQDFADQPKARISEARQDYVRQRNGKTLLFRNKLKSLESTEFVHLKNSNKLIWLIISHAFELHPDSRAPPQLLDFFAEKTSGNPLYIVDAIKQYISMQLLLLVKVGKDDTYRLEITKKFQQKLENNRLPMPISVESVCGMFLDSLTTIQQLALKVAAMNDGECFNRKMVREALPIEDPNGSLNNEWDGLVAADVIQLADGVPQESTTREVQNDPDLILYRFKAEWVKDSLVNRMLYKQRDLLKKQLSQLQANES